MSTNYTQNYKLCQWEPSDKVLRTDFNEDNAKLDAALTAQQTAINRAQSMASSAYSPSYKPVVAGYYTGNGNPTQDINLGFQPCAVLVIAPNFRTVDLTDYTKYIYSGYALLGVDLMGIYACVTITSNGFRVSSETVGTLERRANMANSKYFYLAVR